MGKLRAVLELLKERGVRYQVAVIPRWINVAKDGTRYDVAIDEVDNEYVRSFDALLQEASRSGAVIGMHGYTHQVGDTYRPDGHQESGFGNEFYMPDVKDSMTTQYASQRIIEGAEKFRRIGLFPYFWEAPHYRTLPEQDAVFRNYFGLHFQANVQENRNALQPQYSTGRNTGYGSPSLGAIYVPTPLSYIPYNRDVDIITNQLNKSDKLPALFFHPFLEFKHLLPVMDEDGEPVLKDGLPLYRYPAGEKSPMQKLLPRLAEKGFSFISITDFIPFVPAHSMKVGKDRPGFVKVGDVNGDGQADVVEWDRVKGRIIVTQGDFRGLRNEVASTPSVWCQLGYSKGDVWTLLDDNGDGKADLWVLRANGTMESYRAGQSEFVLSRTWKTGKQSWSDMFALRNQGTGWIIAGEAADGSQLESFALMQGELVPMAPRPWDRHLPVRLTVADLDGDGNDSLLIPFPHSSRWIELVPDTASRKWKRKVLQLTIPTGEDGQVKIGDFNGDGKEDVLFWNTENKKFAVYQQTGPLQFELLSRMGPWGHSTGDLFVCDMNGDGRKDVAELANDAPYLDMALSFQTKRPSAGKP
ncbi:MAG: repeat protein [Paenibacillus sp.]|nr:repeat protein [Paenibacillus sp.]